jgi:metal-responsive CopG/Arc/MetJ family transcriptional regulator
MKTVISANIPVELAIRLKDKTKGTRSRVIARALKNYLDDIESSHIEEVDTLSLILELSDRVKKNSTHYNILRTLYLELKTDEAHA